MTATLRAPDATWHRDLDFTGVPRWGFEMQAHIAIIERTDPERARRLREGLPVAIANPCEGHVCDHCAICRAGRCCGSDRLPRHAPRIKEPKAA